MSTVIAPTAPAAEETFRSRLLDQRAECIRQQELALAETATAVPDPVAVRRATGLAFTVDEIDAALDRIADGSYGRCTSCGIDIPDERLELRPFAAGCVACQASAR
jgi:DnaK suppressor protein